MVIVITHVKTPVSNVPHKSLHVMVNRRVPVTNRVM